MFKRTFKKVTYGMPINAYAEEKLKAQYQITVVINAILYKKNNLWKCTPGENWCIHCRCFRVLSLKFTNIHFMWRFVIFKPGKSNNIKTRIITLKETFVSAMFNNNTWLLTVKSTAECTDLLRRADHSSHNCTNDDNSCSRYNISALTDAVILQCRTF